MSEQKRSGEKGSEQKRSTTGQIPVQAAVAPGGPAIETFDPLAPQKPPPSMTMHQRQALTSEFQDAQKLRQRRALLGTDPGSLRVAADDEVSVVTRKFDGETAPEELQRRDVWKAVQAPVQSREGKRTRELLDQVIRQFAVATNPRYAEDAPGKPRAHIFTWDVSRAMGCEIPHFVVAKELTLAQTCDWLRHEGPMRGWYRVNEYDVLGVVDKGQLVIAMPKDVKVKLLAVVAPQEPPPDAKPRLTGACLKRGSNLTSMECFGVRPLEYFTHA